jgi:hypothetical protein
MTGTQHVGTLKHQFLQYITIKKVLILFHYQNNFEMNYSSAFWWRHLPAACNNFFEAGVSGNRNGRLGKRSDRLGNRDGREEENELRRAFIHLFI